MRTVFARFCKSMRTAFVFGLVMMIAGGALAQKAVQTREFVVIGSAAVQGANVSNAREQAIAESLVTAVALMTAEILQAEAFVENFPQLNEVLFNQTSKFVQGYKLLTEAAHDKSYRVVVQATVSGDKIQKQLSEAGILKTQKTLPSVLLLTAEQNLEDSSPRYWWGQAEGSFQAVTETAIRKHFDAAGFSVVDQLTARKQPGVNWSAFDKPNLTDQEAAELGGKLNADVVVLTTATVNPSANIMGSDTRSFNGTISTRAIRTDSGQEMVALTRTAVAVNEDDVMGGRDALEAAGAMAGEALAGDLAAEWQKQAGKPAEVEMLIRGTGHLASYVKFRKSLNTINGVGGIRVKEIKPNEATLMVEYTGKAKDLASALMQQNFGSFGINIFEVTQNVIKVELIPG